MSNVSIFDRDLVSQYQAVSVHKANADLIERWEYTMRFSGDRRIKPLAAEAKRAATALEKVCADFPNLGGDRESTFREAASGMRTLATDLLQLCKWARGYRAFCEMERKKELDAIARERWGKDTEAFELERGFIVELQSHAGRTAFAEWMQVRGHFLDIEVSDIEHPFIGSNFVTQESSRESVAGVIASAKSRGRKRWESSSGYAIAGWEDYEDWYKDHAPVKRPSSITTPRHPATA